MAQLIAEFGDPDLRYVNNQGRVAAIKRARALAEQSPELSERLARRQARKRAYRARYEGLDL